MYSKYGAKSKSKVGIEGSETFGQLKDGRVIAGNEKFKSGNLSHSGKEKLNQSKEISGNLSHSGRENFNHSNEISGQEKVKLKLGNVKVRTAGQASVGKLEKDIVGKLNLGIEGSVIFGKLSLGRVRKERFLGGSR